MSLLLMKFFRICLCLPPLAVLLVIQALADWLRLRTLADSLEPAIDSLTTQLL